MGFKIFFDRNNFGKFDRLSVYDLPLTESIYKDEQGQDHDLLKGVEAQDFGKKDIEDIHSNRGKEKAKGAMKLGKVIHRKTVEDRLLGDDIKGVKNDKGQELNLDNLKNFMVSPPTEIITTGSNTKLDKNDSAITYKLTLPAYQGIYFDKKKNKFQLIRTCPQAGACAVSCYAGKNGYIMYPASAEKASKVLTLLLNNPNGFKNKIVSELKQAYANASIGPTGDSVEPNVVLRWHDAGDFFSKGYVKMAEDIMKETPFIKHYAYTKSVDMLKNSPIPGQDNANIRYSTGGKQDDMVDTKKDLNAPMVPRSYVKDLDVKKVPVGDPKLKKFKTEMSEQDRDTLKDRLAKKYGIEKNTIFFNDQLQDISIGEAGMMNVFIFPWDSDEASPRPDVHSTMLLQH